MRSSNWSFFIFPICKIKVDRKSHLCWAQIKTTFVWKDFSNWKSISNAHDIDIFFADPGNPGQRGLDEYYGLLKQMDFTNIS